MRTQINQNERMTTQEHNECVLWHTHTLVFHKLVFNDTHTHTTDNE